MAYVLCTVTEVSRRSLTVSPVGGRDKADIFIYRSESFVPKNIQGGDEVTVETTGDTTFTGRQRGKIIS